MSNITTKGHAHKFEEKMPEGSTCDDFILEIYMII